MQMAQKILIIEDEDGIIHLLNLYLKNAGYDIVVAKDGADGLAPPTDSAVSARSPSDHDSNPSPSTRGMIRPRRITTARAIHKTLARSSNAATPQPSKSGHDCPSPRTIWDTT